MAGRERWTWVFIACAMGAVCAGGASVFAGEEGGKAPAAGAEPAAPFGEPVNGLQLALEVKPTTWAVGATVEFLCTMKNVSDKPIRVAAWGFDMGPALEITDAAGHVVQFGGGRNASRLPTANDFPVIEPGQMKPFTLRGQLTLQKVLTVGELLGGAWTWQLADGKYSVRAVLERTGNEDAGLPNRELRLLLWKGKAFSPSVQVTVGGEKPAAAAPATAVGGEAVNGLKLTVADDKTELRMKPIPVLQATKDTPRWDTEPVKLTFTFTNVSAKPIKLNTYDLVWSRLKLDVRGPDAESVRIVKRALEREMMPPRAQDYPVIEPGKSWTYTYGQTFPGNFGENNYILMQPGEYRLRVTYDHPVRAVTAISKDEAESWTGTVTSNEIVLKGVAVKTE